MNKQVHVCLCTLVNLLVIMMRINALKKKGISDTVFANGLRSNE